MKPPSRAHVSTVTFIRCYKELFYLFLYYLLFCDSIQYFIKPSFGLSYERISRTAQRSDGQIASVVDVVIIGGGPVGLATALTLSRPPHNCQVCVVESNTGVDYYDPTKAFLYNINARGLKFVTKFPRLYEKLQHCAVRSQSMRSNFMIVPADPNTPLPSVHDKEDKPMDTDKVSYWLPRHEFTRIMKDVAEEESLNFQTQKSKNTETSHGVGSLSLLFGMECLDVLPSAPGDVHGATSNGVDILLKNITSNHVSTVRCTLAVGADGYKSLVRNCLGNTNNQNNKFRASELWPTVPSTKFQMKRYHSPATGLRIKVLQLPPQFEIGNVTSTYVTQGHYIYAIRGRNKKPREYINLGLLPLRDNSSLRPANVITRPNHVLWTLQTGRESKEWFQKSFPRLNFTSLVPEEEWDRFARAPGSRFPHCQYSNGVALSSLDQRSGVALVGDAIHSFPPDIGQGINAGLADVIALDNALRSVNLSSSNKRLNSDPSSLGDALYKYDRDRVKETKALISLARFGNPYQYRQPLLIDKIGKALWMTNVVVRAVLNKVSFGLLPPAAIILCNQKPELSFHQVMLRSNLLTLGLGTLVSFLVKRFCVLPLWLRISKF